MAALTAQQILASFEQLLHVDTDGGGATTTLVPVKDGDNGTTFALRLSSDKVAFSPTINFYASVSAGGTTYFRMVADNGSTVYAYVHYDSDTGAHSILFGGAAPA